MASDMIPLPALAALIIHTLWIIIFGPIVSAYHVFPDRPCGRPGVQYQAVCGGFLAIYGTSWVFELALFIVGCRGMLFGRGSNLGTQPCLLSVLAQASVHPCAATAVQAHHLRCRKEKQWFHFCTL